MTIKSIPLALALVACDAHALDAARIMAELTWEKRVLVIFTPDSSDADFLQQDEALVAQRDGLIDRHMTVVRVYADGRVSVDGRSRGDSAASFHEHFNADPDRFRVFLVGKDGTVKLDREAPVSTGELFSLIDSMPMRRQEMRLDG